MTYINTVKAVSAFRVQDSAKRTKSPCVSRLSAAAGALATILSNAASAQTVKCYYPPENECRQFGGNRNCIPAPPVPDATTYPYIGHPQDYFTWYGCSFLTLNGAKRYYRQLACDNRFDFLSGVPWIWQKKPYPFPTGDAYVGGGNNCTSDPPINGYFPQIKGIAAPQYACPLGYSLGTSVNSEICVGDVVPAGGPDPDLSAGTCGAGGNASFTPNPINVGTGNKALREHDYGGSGTNALEFTRTYNHLIGRGGPWVMSQKWTHSYSRWVQPISPTIINLFRKDGRMLTGRLVDPTLTNGRQAWQVNSSSDGQLFKVFDTTGVATGWILINDSAVEVFDAGGRLREIIENNGARRSISYSDGSLATGESIDALGNLTGTPLPPNLQTAVVDSFGRSLKFSYNTSARLIRITNPAGKWTAFSYTSDGHLLEVAHPDAARRSFLLNEAGLTSGTSLPAAITGVIDEVGQRFGEYEYDAKGRAVRSSRFADQGNQQPVETWRLSYQVDAVGNPVATAITSPNGVVSTEQISTVRGVAQSAGRNQPAGSGCGPSSSAITYDANANATSRTDFNGFKTCYAYDLSRNLETKRVEGLSSSADCTFGLSSPPAGARLISTQWHPDWRFETKIAEPKKLTTIVYNGQGATCAPDTVLVDGKPPAVVCSRTEQASTDETGAAGFAATVTGIARTWSYTYTTYGRVLTATDPNGAVTSYAYHPDNDANLGRRGNVASVTNALGHVTRITAYNAHGQPTRIIDPNNLVTDLTYDLRMRLTRRKVGNETTSFVYDAAGQLTRVTLPDGARLTYTYDAAQRLTGIQDHKGNKVAYTLDAMGNRINEKLTDPGGVLVRNIQRSIDALNRVQQVTGAVH
jgi:YD repeat-containing protein